MYLEVPTESRVRVRDNISVSRWGSSPLVLGEINWKIKSGGLTDKYSWLVPINQLGQYAEDLVTRLTVTQTVFTDPTENDSARPITCQCNVMAGRAAFQPSPIRTLAPSSSHPLHHS